jgi:ABC-type transport system substrate-binding protein
MKRTGARALASFIVLSLLVGFGASAQGQTDMEGTHGGTLRVALSGMPDINPLTADTTQDWQVIDLLYDSLARIDPISLLPEPWLAESWTVEDPWVNVTLRDGVTFHDGTPVEAADVAFTFGASGLGSSAKYSALLTGLQTTPVDSKTVSFDTSGMASAGLFFTEVMTAPILPATFTGEENGAGPFMVPPSPSGTTEISYVNDMVVSLVTSPPSDLGNNTTATLKHHYFYDEFSGDSFGSLTVYENGSALVQGTDYDFNMVNGTIWWLPGYKPELNSTITADYDFTIQWWTIEAYDGYWVEDHPFLQTIEYTWYPDDPATPSIDEGTDAAAKAIIDGSIDFIGWTLTSADTTNLRWEGTEFETYVLAARDPQDKAYIAVKSSPGFSFLYFGYNSDAGRPGNDPGFREAVTLMINKENAMGIDASGSVTHSPINSDVAAWYNYSQPTYDASFKGTGTAKTTNIDAGVFLLDTLGYFDRDGDGWREDPAGNPLSVDIIGPDFAINPKWPNLLGDMETALAKAGIQNTVTRKDVWSDIWSDVDADNFDIYLGWADGTLDPSFMSGLEPIVRLADAEIDSHLSAADSSLDIADRQMHVRWAQGVLGQKLPMQPILSFPVVEAYTMEPFTGWVSIPGGVNNFWTFVGLRQPKMGDLFLKVTTDTTSLGQGDTAEITVAVKDAPQEGANVGNVYLTLSVTGGGSLAVTADWTDDNGFFSTTYTSPTGVTDVTEVTIDVTATKEQWGGDTGSVSMTVHPDVMYLKVLVDTGDSTLNSGESTALSVQVSDQDNQAVSGAEVTLVISQPGGEATATSWTTDANGVVNATFQGDVTQTTVFTLTATAVKAGYASGQGSDSVAVFGAGETPPEPIKQVEQIPALGLASLAVAIIVIGMVIRAKRSRDE